MARAVGLLELFARLGRITVAESMINGAYEYNAEQQWRSRLHDNPHGEPWFTSMHVSSFPGGDPRPCPRKLAYGLMAFAETETLPQKAQAAGRVGVAAESWVVDMLDLDGRLLSASDDAAHQIGFESADHWLTGSPDIICLPPFWNRPLVIEAKTAYLEQVEEMRNLKRPCTPAHARQCMGYVGLGHHISPQLWPRAVVCKHTWRLAEEGIEPVIDAMVCRDHGINADSGCLIEIDLHPIRDGIVLYQARDHLEIRKSWYFEHDEHRFQRGLEVLRTAQAHYANDELPPHPFGGKQWSADPCKFCNYKKNVCKPDHQAGVTKLTESHGVEWSRGVYGQHAYNPATIRQAVLERWRDRSGYHYTLPEGYTIGRNGVQRERTHA